LLIAVRTFEGFAVGGLLPGLQLVCETTREQNACYENGEDFVHLESIGLKSEVGMIEVL